MASRLPLLIMSSSHHKWGHELVHVWGHIPPVDKTLVFPYCSGVQFDPGATIKLGQNRLQGYDLRTKIPCSFEVKFGHENPFVVRRSK